jgi:hypothetical protein
MSRKKRKKPGPKPVVVKIEGDWVDALKRVLHIKRPKEWPRVPEELEPDREDDAEDSLQDQ